MRGYSFSWTDWKAQQGKAAKHKFLLAETWGLFWMVWLDWLLGTSERWQRGSPFMLQTLVVHYYFPTRLSSGACWEWLSRYPQHCTQGPTCLCWILLSDLILSNLQYKTQERLSFVAWFPQQSLMQLRGLLAPGGYDRAGGSLTFPSICVHKLSHTELHQLARI